MIEYVALGKAIAPLAGRAAAVLAQKTVAGQKIPWDIAADVADAIEDFPIKRGNLRAALKKPALIEALCHEDPEIGAREAVQLFKAELRGQESWRNLDAEELERRCGRVVEQTAKVLLRRLPVADAVALVDARSAARDEAASATAERTLSSVEAIRAQTAGPSLLDRADLHPSIDFELRELVAAFPRAAALVDVFTNATDPAEDLAAWIERPPSWLRVAPLKAWTVLGICLSVLDRPIEAAAALTHALSEGIPDRRRWEAHAAHYLCQGNDPTGARELIAHHTTGHGAALLATLDDDCPRALTALDNWHPDNDLDHDTHVLLASAVLEAQGETLQAIKLLRDRRPHALGTGIALRLAKLLLGEAYAGRATNRDDHLREAAKLAIEVRDLRRRWRGNSVEAILVAADALGQLHDYPTAWKHLRPPPAGDALPHEANHANIRIRAATVATALGDVTLAAQLGDAGAYAEAFLVAIRLEQADDATDASKEVIRAAWAHALAKATEDVQRLWAATRLLVYGGSSPVIDELRQRVPAGFEEIDRVIDVLTGRDRSVVISRLRGIRKTNRLAVMTLADLYDQQGRPDEAANVLAEAADSFDDQHLRLLAATRWAMAGDLPKAADEARRALDKAGGRWVGRQRAQQIVLEDLLSRGDLPEFITVARQYLLDNPDPAVRWALAFAHMKERDPDAAWRVIHESPTPLHPLQPLDALLYLELLTRFRPRRQVVSEAITALKRFGMDDERFAAAVLAAAIKPPEPTEGPDEEPPLELAELGEFIEAFAARYPDSHYFWRFAGDPDDPDGSAEQMLDAVLGILRPGHEHRLKLAKDVSRGQRPTGILTSALGRSYAEGFLLRASGGLRVRSWIPDQQQADQADADKFIAAADASSIVDASALHTCSLIPGDLRDIIMACHTRLLVTADSMADLAAARDSVALTDSRLGLDDHGNLRLTEQDSVALGHRAQVMIDLANRAELVSTAKIPDIDDRDPERFKPWLFLPATAHLHQAYFWCDDEALRRTARATGVQTFSTLELIEALVGKASLSRTQLNDIHQILVAEYTYDLQLSTELLVAQAQKDGWAAGAATAAVARPASWTNVRILFDLIDDAIRQNADTPDNMTAWSYAATIGSCSTQPDPESISDLAKQLLLRCLIGASLSPSMIPPIVHGVRAATEELSAPDPLPAALKELHEMLLTRCEPSVAAQLIVKAIAGLDTPDRHALVQAVLGG